MQLLHIGQIALGLVGLFFGGEFIVSGASRLARSFGVSALIIGLTVVAFGTSLPELLVSLSAATAGSSGIAIGNVVGSNIANIGLILGLTGLVFPVGVERTVVRREIPIMIGVSALFYVLVLDGEISRLDGLLLLGGLIIFNGGLIWEARRSNHHDTDDVDMTVLNDRLPMSRARALVRLGIGFVVLMLGAQFTVDGATGIARGMGVSELVIGITLVAVGTSLPELAASLMAAFRKEADIAIGNVVGSNIFNILGIIGITAIVQPIPVAIDTMHRDYLIMIGFAVLLIPLVWNLRIGRGEAGFLLAAYAAFVFLTFIG